MKLTLLAKDNSSGREGCPSVYCAEDGSLVVQGDLLDSTTEANLLNVLPGEGAVRIKPEIVREALARLT
jgi:hypothetical protein